MQSEDKKPKDLVIEIRGGDLAEVYSDENNLRVVLIDWDNIHDDPESQGAFEFSKVSLRKLPADTAKILGKFRRTVGKSKDRR